jgi:hypothetical protein
MRHPTLANPCPLPGKTHDAKAFKETGAADILKKAGGGFGDKGYQGTGLV